jgi:histidinol phosphatase-like PHP family hydrolase
LRLAGSKRRETFRLDSRIGNEVRHVLGLREPAAIKEINANPWRLDLDCLCMRRRDGSAAYINPDAHSTREIDPTHWGIEMARKGGVPKGRVLNCLTRKSSQNIS